MSLRDELGLATLVAALVATTLVADRHPVALGPSLAATSVLTGLAVLAAATVAVVAPPGSGRRRVALVTMVVGLGVGGGARLHAAASWAGPVGAGRVTADVVDEASGGRFAASIVVDDVRVDGRSVVGRLVVRAGGREAGPIGVARRGDRVVLTGWIRRADGDPWARRARAAAVLDDAALVGLRGPRPAHLVLGAALRSRVDDGLRRVPPRDRALLAGFLLGDTRALDARDRDAFRAAGMSHLLAVSGANVAFVLALVGPLVRRLGLLGRAAAGAGVVVVFAAATRFEPSVVRAGVMALVVMLARVSGRGVSSARALSLAVGVAVVVDPALVHSVGFGLSVAATAGIVLGAERLATRLPGPPVVRDAVAVTVAAQLGVLPLLLATFGTVPLVGVVANVAVAPLAEPLTTIGLVTALVAPALPAPLARAVFVPTRALLAGVRAVAAIAARHPAPVDARGAAIVVGALVIGSAAHARFGRRARG